MGAFQILDLIIGITFVYFLLSLLCVSLQEIKARWREERSENLKKWIYDTFNNGSEKKLGEKLWNNIIIDGLTQEGKSSSYIPKEVFVSALFDEIHYSSEDKVERENEKRENEKKEMAGEGTDELLKEPFDFQSISQSIAKSELLPKRIRRVLLQIHSESYGSLESFRERLERWFEQAMDRNAGTFKKNAQKSVLIFSFIVTIALNVDSIKLIRYFYDNPEETAKVADAAEKMINNPETAARLKTNDSSSVKQLLKAIEADMMDLKKLKLPIGWEDEKWENFLCSTKGWENISILGWLITAFSVSLGAPFWYDILNKLVDLRSAGKKPTDNQDKNNDSKSNTDTPAIA